MKTVGEILQEERGKRGIGLAKVAQETRIRAEFIRVIEKNDFEKFESITTVQGFIKNYAKFLDLSPKFVLAVFRRDFHQDEQGKIIPRGLVQPLNTGRIFNNPRFGLIILTVVFVLGVLGYLAYQYLTLVRGPSLEITFPTQKVSYTSLPTLQLRGKTEPGASVLVNGELIEISAKGKFSYQVELDKGKNLLVIEAANRLGKQNQVIREIYRD